MVSGSKLTTAGTSCMQNSSFIVGYNFKKATKDLFYEVQVLYKKIILSNLVAYVAQELWQTDNNMIQVKKKLLRHSLIVF